MFYVLIDTSVWLDLAENQRQTLMIDVVEELVRLKKMELLVPEIVLSEFIANRDRVVARSIKSMSTHFNLVKEAIRNAPDVAQKEEILSYLSDIDHRVPIVGAAVSIALDRIERLLKKATLLTLSDTVKLAAADRALHRKAPFQHDGKNGMADAVIIESYFEATRSGKTKDRFAFVTHNKSDFSLAGGNHKLPHLDLASGFNKTKSMYFITLGDCIRVIDDIYVDPEFAKALGYGFEPRTLSEIEEAMDELAEQVWYNRHKNREWLVETGKIKVVTEDAWIKAGRDNSSHIIDTVWGAAKLAAEDTLSRLGREKCGPHSDFEWGMINGKLSAIRWVLGDDWDMLDT